MSPSQPGHLTHAEIFQQPETWPETAARVRRTALSGTEGAVLTGAGTSFFAALAVEPAWPGARAVPSTELFLDPRRYLSGPGPVVSFARSGDSPESIAVVEKLPGARHIALTCNPEGRLARWPGVEAILLDPRSNDRSLVMTSSFSNLVLAGLCLARPEEMDAALPLMCAEARAALPALEAAARLLAQNPPARVLVLASPALAGAAREAWLKILEMTAGRVVPLAETYLGLRHGPMSFLEAETLVICFVSSDPALRRYELDLVRELRAKKLGRLVAIAPPGVDGGLFDQVLATRASALPDCLRTPADIVFPQLLAYHLSLRVGLDPDSPSPGRVITRVVEGVRIYED
ncbi:MAG: tagatose-6-phosphate ketose isomerase [Acidobacteriota bacterium]